MLRRWPVPAVSPFDTAADLCGAAAADCSEKNSFKILNRFSVSRHATADDCFCLALSSIQLYLKEEFAKKRPIGPWAKSNWGNSKNHVLQFAKSIYQPINSCTTLISVKMLFISNDLTSSNETLVPFEANVSYL